MAAICCLLCVTPQFSFAQDDIATTLQLALDNRTSSPDKTRTLLNSIDVKQLTPEQNELFKFLMAFSILMEGNTQDAIQKLNQVADTSKSIKIKARAQNALLSIYSNLHDWNNAIDIVNSLKDTITKLEPDELKQNVQVSLLSFYNNIEEFNLAIELADKILNITNNPRTKCSVLEKQLYAFKELKSDLITENNFFDAIALCAKINEKILELAITTNLADFYIEKKRYGHAIQLLNDHLSDAKNLSYKSLTAYYLGRLVVAYLGDDKNTLAEKHAIDILENYSSDNYYLPNMIAYQALSEISSERGEYKESLIFYKQFKELEKRDYDQTVAAKVALQKAKFEKSNEMKLLNQQNKLLSTQAELAAANDRNKNLLLLVATILLAIALFWIYKNRQTHKQLRKIAETDALTGIFNRNHFTQCAEASLAYCQKTQQDVSFIVFDLDYFKRVNDNYGHLVGDWALIQATKAVKQVCRANDIIGRMGGEEFAILLPNCAKDKAIEIAEVCRKQIAAIDTSESGHTFNLTASFGVSHSNQADYNLDKLFACADSALYQSKDSGRNRVYSFQQSQPIADTFPSSLINNNPA
ncbi:GGDEF domain-containing protein [Neptunicella marina]|uniref:diguanylate cyclase n=1 Tax=Neptunicella marina TaxID=2125989 RepID=A0A8J6M4D0_9ALTE|nr:GGDEF domain-containing protein [Neptunicella marina]MBC3767827.1 GGDEF domain-containing protein [Neptunicella marina]